MGQKVLGFIVVESSDDGMIEQVLALVHGEKMPNAGVLDWADSNKPGVKRTVFATRALAKSAIERTEHWRLAFGEIHPEKKYCRIYPVVAN